MILPFASRAVLLVAAIATALTLAACQSSAPRPEGDAQVDAAQAGAIWITRSGCGSCHQIPGIANANGLVGPPLIHWSKRTIVAGYLPNTRDNLVRWIQHPQQVAPGNAMPEAGLSQKQASDIAAYLSGLK